MESIDKKRDRNAQLRVVTQALDAAVHTEEEWRPSRSINTMLQNNQRNYSGNALFPQ